MKPFDATELARRRDALQAASFAPELSGAKRVGAEVELLALEYDWEAASARALANNRPEWAQAMLSGYVK